MYRVADEVLVADKVQCEIEQLHRQPRHVLVQDLFAIVTKISMENISTIFWFKLHVLL